VLIGGTLGAVAAGAGGCARPRWPAAGPLIVSPARLRCARLRGSRSAHYAASCVPCCWAMDCAVPCGGAPPLGRRRTRARVGRSRVACVEVCAVSARAEWLAAASGPAFRPGAATAGGRPGSGGRGGRECACRARVVGIGVRAAAVRAGCGVRATWAGVEGCSLSLARSLALSLSLSHPGLSGMVHVSDVHHWTKSVGSTPPPP